MSALNDSHFEVWEAVDLAIAAASETTVRPGSNLNPQLERKSCGDRRGLSRRTSRQEDPCQRTPESQRR